jgi:hypothetical protein
VTLTVDNAQVDGNKLLVTARASDYGPNGPAIFEADGDGTNITNTHRRQHGRGNDKRRQRGLIGQSPSSRAATFRRCSQTARSATTR